MLDQNTISNGYYWAIHTDGFGSEVPFVVEVAILDYFDPPVTRVYRTGDDQFYRLSDYKILALVEPFKEG